MNEEFQNVFFNEFNGVDVRFRNDDYVLDENDKSTIINWVHEQLSQVKEDNKVDIKVFKELMRVIEVLGKSPKEDSYWLCQRIYSEVEKL